MELICKPRYLTDVKRFTVKATIECSSHTAQANALHFEHVVSVQYGPLTLMGVKTGHQADRDLCPWQ